MIYTIGHSTRTLDGFVAVLKAHGVTELADIRSMPASRRHPHFNGRALARSLGACGIVYRHFPGLGGMRSPRRDSSNTAWRGAAFRGYADYMQTAEFARAVEELLEWAGESAGGVEAGGEARRVPRVAPCVAPCVTMMCAEAAWRECHRQLTADVLVARGIDVRHITSALAAAPHRLTDFARVENGSVTYRGLI